MSFGVLTCVPPAVAPTVVTESVNKSRHMRCWGMATFIYTWHHENRATQRGPKGAADWEGACGARRGQSLIRNEPAVSPDPVANMPARPRTLLTD